MITNHDLISQLDICLAHLAKDNTVFNTHDTLKALVFDNSSKIDVEALVLKLKNEGYIHYSLNDQSTLFKISIEGYDAIRKGGYRAKYEEDEYTQKLAKDQIEAAIQSDRASIKYCSDSSLNYLYSYYYRIPF